MRSRTRLHLRQQRGPELYHPRSDHSQRPRRQRRRHPHQRGFADDRQLQDSQQPRLRQRRRHLVRQRLADHQDYLDQRERRRRLRRRLLWRKRGDRRDHQLPDHTEPVGRHRRLHLPARFGCHDHPVHDRVQLRSILWRDRRRHRRQSAQGRCCLPRCEPDDHRLHHRPQRLPVHGSSLRAVGRFERAGR